MSDTKRCPKCKQTKPVNDFYRSSAQYDGRNSHCKLCSNTWDQNDRKRNPEKYRIRDREQAENHPYFVWARHTIYSHRRRGIGVRITVKQLEDTAIKTKECGLCSMPLNWEYGHKNGKLNGQSPTLDRINNEDFIDGKNMMIVCHRCNTSKGNRSLVEFVSYCKGIVTKYQRTCP